MEKAASLPSAPAAPSGAMQEGPAGARGGTARTAKAITRLRQSESQTGELPVMQNLRTKLTQKNSELKPTLKDISLNSCSDAVTSVTTVREYGINTTIHMHSHNRPGMLNTTLEPNNCYHVFEVMAELRLSVKGFTWISNLSWAQHFEVAILFQNATCNRCVLSISKP